MSVFYSKPQRLDVYVDNSLVAPTNAQWNADNTDYTLKKPVYAGTKALLADNVTAIPFRQYNKQVRGLQYRLITIVSLVLRGITLCYCLHVIYH